MSWTDAVGRAVAVLACAWMLAGAPLPRWYVRWLEDPQEGEGGAPREW